MRTVRLTGQFVERVHDELIGFYFPNVEPVSARDHRDLAALEGALAAPFATAFGAEAFPTVQDKAARLFYGIAANHPFSNGNKRTALVAVDALCYANSFYLDMSSRTAVWGARLAASHNAKGIPHVEAYRRLARAFARDMFRLRNSRLTIPPSIVTACGSVVGSERHHGLPAPPPSRGDSSISFES